MVVILAYITRSFSDSLDRVLDEFLSLCFCAETIDFWLGELNFSLVVIFILRIQKPSDKIMGLNASRKEKLCSDSLKNLSPPDGQGSLFYSLANKRSFQVIFNNMT